ncbi:MAG: hypothetical protein J6336_05510, partial [Kiritimatiellae bacterium]|nr:hypothetical protein [Kiritimatiellia bacterium]
RPLNARQTDLLTLNCVRDESGVSREQIGVLTAAQRKTNGFAHAYGVCDESGVSREQIGVLTSTQRKTNGFAHA